ncbi:serine protease inhibitor Cvsi-1-like [Pecten maximus]|uniref:serine protease inhibitor Cvsi-1-like n=1 Tax=Pecten maximus TaxID=6579 RepID=UPI0014588B85|nr:serine protease inhibitor Cvsi-1-like [Pecten maximus]XP_033729528.1 serine protease inhibitor Cvsi-1-like [Pecten maximus]XP_033729529.1 serine protease inhibitor Cvsi-1-like [Pecten maximus]
MNTLTCLVLAACVALAVSEPCTDANSCTDTTCNTGTKECVAIQGQHLCTCVHSNQHNVACTAVGDCTTDRISCNQHGPNTPVHCVDSFCRCEGQGHNHGNHHPPGGHQPAAAGQHHNN